MIRFVKIAGLIVGVPVGLATIAAAWFGAIQTYWSNHTAFFPVVSFESPILKSFQPASRQSAEAGGNTDVQDNALVGITIPITLFNSGGQAGCIAEVGLKVQSN